MPTCAPGRLSPSAQGPGTRVLTCSRWPLHAQLQALCSRSGLSVLLPPKAPAFHLSGALVSWDLNQRQVAPWMAFQALDTLSRCSHPPPPAHHEHPPTGRAAARPPPLEQRNQRKPCSRRRTWALTDQNCRPIVPGSDSLGNRVGWNVELLRRARNPHHCWESLGGSWVPAFAPQALGRIERQTALRTEYFLNLFFFFSCLFAFSRATPGAYGGSQARGRMAAAAVSLRQGHSTGPDPRCLHQILNPQSQARDRTCILTETTLGS